MVPMPCVMNERLSSSKQHRAGAVFVGACSCVSVCHGDDSLAHIFFRP